MPLLAEKHAYRCYPPMTMDECQQALIKSFELFPSSYHMENGEFHFMRRYWEQHEYVGEPKSHLQITGKLIEQEDKLELYWEVKNICWDYSWILLPVIGFLFILVLLGIYMVLFLVCGASLYYLIYRLMVRKYFYDKEFDIHARLPAALHLTWEEIEKIPL